MIHHFSKSLLTSWQALKYARCTRCWSSKILLIIIFGARCETASGVEKRKPGDIIISFHYLIISFHYLVIISSSLHRLVIVFIIYWSSWLFYSDHLQVLMIILNDIMSMGNAGAKCRKPSSHPRLPPFCLSSSPGIIMTNPPPDFEIFTIWLCDSSVFSRVSGWNECFSTQHFSQYVHFRNAVSWKDQVRAKLFCKYFIRLSNTQISFFVAGRPPYPGRGKGGRGRILLPGSNFCWSMTFSFCQALEDLFNFAS